LPRDLAITAAGIKLRRLDQQLVALADQQFRLPRAMTTTADRRGIDKRLMSATSKLTARLKSPRGADLSHTLGMRDRSPCVRKRP
jgi:hypothetical protein